MKVLVDTNGLMVPGQHGIDIFDELRRLGFDKFLVPSAVRDEIVSLQGKVTGKDRASLTIAASLLGRCEIVEAAGNADDVLVRLGKETDTPVFTNDAALRKRLKTDGVRVIFMRSRHRLEIE